LDFKGWSLETNINILKVEINYSYLNLRCEMRDARFENAAEAGASSILWESYGSSVLIFEPDSQYFISYR
jgi:hypothetical protein